ncbi:MAG: hypothetical protein HY870_14760 [Chloroflexi bacterium]|nr:hypothetical protein [Chloroflexota bacterium]
MTPFDELQREHEQLLEQADVAAVVAYIDRARAQAAQIGDPRERDQLRANLRYWASYVYDRNGTYPATTLLPAAMGKSIVPPPTPEPIIKEAAPAPRPVWPWLIGIAVIAVIVAATYLAQFGLMQPAPAPLLTPTGTSAQGGNAGITDRLQPLSTTTDLYDKPGSDAAAQMLGRMQAGSEFYAIARTADRRWLKITTVDEVSGWIRAADSGIDNAALEQLPEAAVVIVSTPTSTPVPTSTPAAAAGDGPTPTVPLPTSTKAALRATSTPAGQKPATPTGPEPPSNAVPLQVNYQIMTYGPSPFNAAAWVIDVQLLAAGGDNRYVFWVNGQRLAADRYTIDGVACRAASFTIGATSGGQAVRRDVTLKSPLTTCQ